MKISFTLFVTCAIVGVHYGTGRHAVDLTQANFDEAMKVSLSYPLVQQKCRLTKSRTSIGGSVISGTASL